MNPENSVQRFDLPSTPSAWIRLVLSNYGPLAFGLVSLLAIWTLIVGPELERNRIQSDKLLLVADSIKEAANAVKSATDKLERLYDRAGITPR